MRLGRIGITKFEVTSILADAQALTSEMARDDARLGQSKHKAVTIRYYLSKYIRLACLPCWRPDKPILPFLFPPFFPVFFVDPLVGFFVSFLLLFSLSEFQVCMDIILTYS